MDRVPPHDTASEQALLGVLIIDPTLIGSTSDRIVPSDFYTPRHVIIHRTLVEMWNEGEPIDPITLSATLRASNELDGIGGNATITDLMAGAGFAGNCEAYVSRIIECSSYRKLIASCSATVEAAYGQTSSATDLAEYLSGAADGATVAEVNAVPDDLWQMDTFLDRPLVDRPQWVIPGLLRSGWRVMVVAAEGVGKTVLFRQIGLAAAQGIHPLNFQPMKPIRTLIVDLENPEDSIADVCEPIRRQVQAWDPESYDPDRAWLWHRPSGINVRNRRDRAELESVIASVRPDLVCLGPIYKAYRVEARESDELAGAEVMSVFDDLRTRYGFGMLLEHHAPKGSGGSRDLMPYGSSLWLRWPEIGIKLTPREEDNRVMTVGRWRGDRLENAWPMELERGLPWPWVGIWPTGTFDDPKVYRSDRGGHDEF